MDAPIKNEFRFLVIYSDYFYNKALSRYDHIILSVYFNMSYPFDLSSKGTRQALDTYTKHIKEEGLKMVTNIGDIKYVPGDAIRQVIYIGREHAEAIRILAEKKKQEECKAESVEEDYPYNLSTHITCKTK